MASVANRSRSDLLRSSSRGLLGRVQAQAGPTRRVSRSVTLQPPAARMIEHFARLRHPPGKHEGEAAQRIDILVDRASRASISSATSSSSARASASHTPSLTSMRSARRLLVMLVLDLADDLLDHVLDGHHALGAAELVDDDGEMDPPGAHPRQKIEHAHRFGHVERASASVSLMSSGGGLPRDAGE